MFDACPGLLVGGQLYALVIAGWLVADSVSVNIDEQGDRVAVQRAALVGGLVDRFPGQIPPRVLRDMGRMGDDVMAVTVEAVVAWVENTPTKLVFFTYTWKCGDNTRSCAQLAHVLRLRDAAREAAARCGKKFASLGANEPVWLSRDAWDAGFRALPNATRVARKKHLAWLDIAAGQHVLIEDAAVSARERLWMYFPGGFSLPHPPRVRGRQLEDALEAWQQPGQPPSLPGLAAMVGLYAPWLAGGVLTASPSLGTPKDAEERQRRALDEQGADAQAVMQWGGHRVGRGRRGT